MKNALKKEALATVIRGESPELIEQFNAIIKIITDEAQQTKGKASANATAVLNSLATQFADVKHLKGGAALTGEQCERLLKAVNQGREQLETLRADNMSLGKGGIGADGLTITKRLRDKQSDLATKESIIALLHEINDTYDAIKEAKTKEHQNLKNALRQGLSAFLGPAGPLVETFASLKDEYGDDAKKIARKLSKWWKGDQDILKELEKEAGRNERRDKKLFGMLSDNFRKFSGLLGSGGSSVLDKIEDFFGWGGNGKGKGGMLTKAKRFARKLPGVGKLMRGGLGGKVAGGFGKSALARGLGLAARTGSRFLPGVGIAIGAHGLATMGEAKDTDTVGDKAMAYGGAALDGASIGAGIGTFIAPGIGTAIGAAIGAFGGVVYAGFKRNWKDVEKAASKSWTSVKSAFFSLVDGAKSFGLAFLDLPNKLTNLLTSGVEKVFTWLKDNIPGFEKLVNWAGDKANQLGTTVNEVATDTKIAVAGAVQTGANKVSSVLDPVAKTLADSKSPVNAAMGSAAATISKSAQGVAAFAGKMAMPDKDIKSAILGAADKVGVDKGYMMAMTAQESSFNPNAKAKTSSAKGLNQFIDGTWKDMVDKYGKQYGIGINDQFDPKKNAMMGALFARDNATTLKGQGHDVSSASLYAAHMLGSGGANQLLSAIKKNPGGNAVDLMPKAAAANRGVFYNRDDTPRTVKEVYAYYQDKIESRAQAYNNALSKEIGSSTQMAGSVAPSAEKTPAAAVSQSVAPGTDAFERAGSVTPDAHITMAPDADIKTGTNRAYGNGGVETRQTAATDVPFVLGDNHMVVINAGMMGA